MEEKLDPVNFPDVGHRSPGRVSKGAMGAVKRERKRMLLEMAAMTYVAMEYGDYVYAGVKRRYDEDRNLVPNKSEVMRRAGYRGKTIEQFDKYLGDNDYFWELVELYRLRRSDPMFRKDHENQLLNSIASSAARLLYERVTYYPHEMSTSEALKVLHEVFNVGIKMHTVGAEDNRADELLESLTPELREKALVGYKESLETELDRIEALEKAHKGADQE